jgi:cytidyltransferase-like protein
MKKIVLVTGGFDPLHSGHISYFNASKQLGDLLVVGVNSDEWLRRKKGREFMPWNERATIISNIVGVHQVINFDDSDNSAKDAIRKVRDIFPKDNIVFANGGDRTEKNIPEMDLLTEIQHLNFVFGVGGFNKSNSSSWILEEWKAPKTKRPWGYYRVLHEVTGMKVKELTVEPGQSLSMQRHHYRAEYWIVSEGCAVVNAQLNTGYALPPKSISVHNEYRVPVAEWHQLTNPFDVPVKIIEIQYGEQCREEDIERQ